MFLNILCKYLGHRADAKISKSYDMVEQTIIMGNQTLTEGVATVTRYWCKRCGNRLGFDGNKWITMPNGNQTKGVESVASSKGDIEKRDNVQTKVTAEMLEKMGASCEGIDKFKRVFPDGAEITLENCLKAAEHNLSILWFALHYLPSSCRKTYIEAITPYIKTYFKATVPSFEVYNKAKALTFWETYQQYEKRGFK